MAPVRSKEGRSASDSFVQIIENVPMAVGGPSSLDSIGAGWNGQMKFLADRLPFDFKENAQFSLFRL